MESFNWKTIRKQTLLDASPWLRVISEDLQLPDGRLVEGYLQLEAPDYVMVVAVNTQFQLGLIRSYKHGLRRIDVQPPAGYLEKGEDPLQAAKRELLEETGCEAQDWQSLGMYVISGNRGAGKAHFFMATDCIQVARPEPGDLEEQQVIWSPITDVKRLWLEGRFFQISSTAILGLAFAHLEGCQLNSSSS